MMSRICNRDVADIRRRFTCRQSHTHTDVADIRRRFTCRQSHTHTDVADIRRRFTCRQSHTQTSPFLPLLMSVLFSSFLLSHLSPFYESFPFPAPPNVSSSLFLLSTLSPFPLSVLSFSLTPPLHWASSLPPLLFSFVSHPYPSPFTILPFSIPP